MPLWGEQATTWIQGGREFHVGPGGKPENAGTKAEPWDLRSTLEGKHKLRGGDVVWVAGGIYKGCFTAKISGAKNKPVVVRAVPGERAVLDGVLDAGKYILEIPDTSAWCVFWGLEIMVSDPTDIDDRRPSGFWFNAPNSKLINCHVHDTANCGFWRPAVDSEIYGCLLHNIGGQRKGRGQGNGHNIYTQNEIGAKRIRDNVIFNGFRNGIDIYTQQGFIDGYDLIGNTVFGASACANEGDKKMDIVIGGKKPASRILVRENLGWANGLGRHCEFGYWTDSLNKDIRLIDNTFAGHVKFRIWQTIEMTGNKFYGGISGPVKKEDHPGNDYGAPPRESVVFVRPNEYEPGRANLTVYNWADADTVPADLSKVVPVGAEFEIRNAQNWHKGPVVKGVYDGKPVSLPMAGMDPVQPIGAEGYIAREEMTGRAFNVFVVQSWTAGSRR